MHHKVEESLGTAVQALAITSNILAIAIEGGILVGGAILVKRYLLTDSSEKKALPAAQETVEVALVPVETKPTLKERMNKVKRIIGAILG